MTPPPPRPQIRHCIFFSFFQTFISLLNLHRGLPVLYRIFYKCNIGVGGWEVGNIVI